MDTKKHLLVFPHQLFRPHPGLEGLSHVAIVEDSLFFGDVHHPMSPHKQKLWLHRASMQIRGMVAVESFKVEYVEHVDGQDVLGDDPSMASRRYTFIARSSFLEKPWRIVP